MEIINEMKRQFNASDVFLCDVTNFIVYNQIKGDYLEFGVYKGNTLLRTDYWMKIHWQEYLNIFKDHQIDTKYNNDYLLEKRFFAFDSFQGLPASNSKDTPLHFSEGAYKSSYSRFTNNLQNNLFDMSKLITVKGWFSDTLNNKTKTKFNLSKASIIFIDCDLYESALPVFDFINSLIHDGTVLIIDDFFRYKGHPCKGIQSLYNCWIKKNTHIHTAELSRCCANRIAFVCNII